jgi:hypothetical protein
MWSLNSVSNIKIRSPNQFIFSIQDRFFFILRLINVFFIMPFFFIFLILYIFLFLKLKNLFNYLKNLIYKNSSSNLDNLYILLNYIFTLFIFFFIDFLFYEILVEKYYIKKISQYVNDAYVLFNEKTILLKVKNFIVDAHCKNLLSNALSFNNKYTKYITSDFIKISNEKYRLKNIFLITNSKIIDFKIFEKNKITYFSLFLFDKKYNEFIEIKFNNHNVKILSCSAASLEKQKHLFI